MRRLCEDLELESGGDEEELRVRLGGFCDGHCVRLDVPASDDRSVDFDLRCAERSTRARYSQRVADTLVMLGEEDSVALPTIAARLAVLRVRLGAIRDFYEIKIILKHNLPSDKAPLPG